MKLATDAAPPPRSPWPKRAVLGLLVYWMIYALVVPITTWDSHTYNLARLRIAHQQGFFGTAQWNSERQLAFPWTFDAVHYPFLFLGWGYALPSFACFIGLLIIVFRMVRSRYDEQTAWYCCLGLLALPTLVFQAVSTKNDLAVVFGLACWAYARWRFGSDGRALWLFCAALGLGFAAGAKSSGVVFSALLAAFTLFDLRTDRRAMAQFAGFGAACLVGWGSVEIYANNLRVFGNAIGPPVIRDHAQHDGIRGMLANVIRHTLGSVNVGIDLANPNSLFSTHMTGLCRDVLKFTHLEGKGYQTDLDDTAFRFIKSNREVESDFGPVGTLALITSIFLLLARPERDPLRLLAASGLGSLLILCGTVAWIPCTLRFLLLPFGLVTVAVSIFFVRETSWARVGRTLFFALALASAILYPLRSFNKGPRHVWMSLADRERMMTLERPTMLEVIQDLRARGPALGNAPILLYAGGDSWVYPVLQIRELPIVSCGRFLSLPLLREIARVEHTRRLYILTLNRNAPEGIPLRILRAYEETGTALYKWDAPQP